MSATMLRRVLRGAAIAIAMLAWVDPAIERERRQPLVALVRAAGADAALADATRAALGVESTITTAPDPEADAWVVVARSLEHLGPVPAEVPTSLVLPDRPGAFVRVERVHAPRRVPAGSRAAVDVLLHARGLAGRESMVRVSRSSLELARVTHRWTKDEERATVRLAPIVDGRTPVRLHVSIADGPADDGTADIVIVPVDRPIQILTVEARPSWLATFVRRSLLADPALAVRSWTRVARGVTAGTAGAGATLSATALGDVDVVVAGGLDALSGSDVTMLDGFVRQGGALLLLPDTAAVGVAGALVPARRLVDRLSETPVAVRLPVIPAVDLWASELAVAEEPWPGASLSPTVGQGFSAASADTVGPGSSPAGSGLGADTVGQGFSPAARPRLEPLVVDAPHGAGRVLVVGALDAWRHRDRNDGAFDRAWPALVRALAASRARGPTLELTPQLAAPGESVRADLTLPSPWAGTALELEARMANRTVRLLPDTVTGTLSGTLSAPGEPGVSAVSVRVAGCGPAGAACVVEAPLLVAEGARVPAADEAVRAGIEAGGGVVVESRGLDRLRAHLRNRTPRRAASHTWFPMRSAWWLLPFATCLGAEWLLRRRAGLR